MDRLRAYLDELIPKTQPAFRPTAIQGLLQPRPEAEIKTPESFVRSGFLGENNIGRQLGLLGLGFAPGAGFSDYAGTFPSAQGGVEPGFQQNIQQGNYLTAGLQGLGALGDAATLSAAALGPFAPLAAGVGMTAKAPRAVQRGVKGLIDAATPAPTSVMPQVDELGFYSAVEKAVLDNPQQKGTGQQFLAQLQKTPGVKPEELQYTGLDQFLANRPNVTKTEIQDFLDTNRVQLQEVVLGKQPTRWDNNTLIVDNQPIGEIRDSGIGYVFMKPDGTYSELQSNRMDQAVNEVMQLTGTAQTPQTSQTMPKFSSYTLPGGENYREVLLTLPSDVKTPKGSVVRDNVDPDYPFAVVVDGQVVNRLNSNERAEEYIQEAVREVVNKRKTPGVYQSSHFEEPNVLAHMRVNDRTVDGKPTLFVEEIQSDWHQAGRKKGYETDPLTAAEKQEFDEIRRRSIQGTSIQDAERMRELQSRAKGVPDAPFKTSWHELTLKKAINEAATKGYDQIAFTTGATQAERYNLSKQADSVGYFDNTTLVIYGKDGNAILKQNVPANEISKYTGKDVADKLLAQKSDSYRMVGGVNFEVGGEGMKGFYDKILPKSLEKLGKKYNVKPVLTEMDTPDGKVQVWKFPVPKEMAETVRSQGQPLFQIGAGTAGLGTAGLLATEEELF
jgi:hypothetical protein